jgi:hypothetical protein
MICVESQNIKLIKFHTENLQMKTEICMGAIRIFFWGGGHGTENLAKTPLEAI